MLEPSKCILEECHCIYHERFGIMYESNVPMFQCKQEAKLQVVNFLRSYGFKISYINKVISTVV
jgi:hypothetical protein